MKIDQMTSGIPDGCVDISNRVILTSEGPHEVHCPRLLAVAERLGFSIIKNTERALRRVGVDTAGPHEHYRPPRPHKARQLGAGVMLAVGTLVSLQFAEEAALLSVEATKSTGEFVSDILTGFDEDPVPLTLDLFAS